MKLKSLILLIFIVLSPELYALEYKTYKFHKLANQLGYPNETYFGSTAEEVFDLETYTSKEDTFYREINDYLRFFPAPYDWNGTSPEDARAMVASIDKIFARIPAIPQDLILFRGVGLKHRKNQSFRIGVELVEKGYVSTSTSFKVAQHFATKNSDESKIVKKVIFVLYQNYPGQKGILIDQGEDEVLLKHGQALKVMALKKIGLVNEIYLVQVCKISCVKRMNKDIARFWKNFKSVKTH
ncbi:MAG: ADP-ribosyltransferase [Bacteriovoracaceae bacterium]|nr:ADP-ribosyltransferase [Bacteriovoracaceae bacterium]